MAEMALPGTGPPLTWSSSVHKFGRNLIDGHPVSDFSRVVQT